MGSPPKDTIWESLHQLSFFTSPCGQGVLNVGRGGGNDRHLYRYYLIVAITEIVYTAIVTAIVIVGTFSQLRFVS